MIDAFFKENSCGNLNRALYVHKFNLIQRKAWAIAYWLRGICWFAMFFYLKSLRHDKWIHLDPHPGWVPGLCVCVCVHFHIFIFRPGATMRLGGLMMSFGVMVQSHIWKIGHRRRDRTNLLHMVGFKSSPGVVSLSSPSESTSAVFCEELSRAATYGKSALWLLL